MRIRRLAAAVLALAFVAMPPAMANHAQTVGNATVTFDHDGDNEWWVEVLTKPGTGDSVVAMEVRSESGTFRGLQQKAIVNGWTKWGPEQAFRIPAGERVQFRAHVLDQAGGGPTLIDSCFFTHPAGVEQCASPPPPPPPPPPGDFDATFTGVRGSEWWVQASVATNGPAIQSVEVRKYLNGAWGPFQPVAKHSWGWGSSYHFPQGSILQLRANAVDGQSDLSSCRQWIPPQGANAAIVTCPGTSPPPPPPPPPSGLNAKFSNVKGNNYWTEAVITANGPIYGVFLIMDCDPNKDPADMTYRADWGKWTLGNTYIAPGTRVTMYAFGEKGSTASGGYIWPQATPTSGCPAPPAWPREGSTLRYELHNDLSGGGQGWQTTAWLNLTFDQLEGSDPGVGFFTGTCTGRTVFWDVDGSQTVTRWVEPTTVNPPVMTRTPRVGFEVGWGNMPSLLYVDHFGTNSGDCRSDDSADWTVTTRGQQTKEMRLLGPDGQPRTMTVWHADNSNSDPDSAEFKVIEWETKAGLVLHWERMGMRSGMGNFGGDLIRTDAPI